MVLATMNAVETASRLNYYVCPPEVYFDYFRSRSVKRNFSEVRPAPVQ